MASALTQEWQELLFNTKIRDNVSLAEAPSNGQDIHTYKGNSFGSADYKALAQEFLERTQQQVGGKMMAGLGKRGQEKVSKAPVNELFRQTENTQNSDCANTETQPVVRKQYVFSFELAEKLREFAFKARRKEVDIVREALEEYLERRGQK